MSTTFALVLSACMLAADQPTSGGTAYDPTDHYETRQVEGWTVHVNKDLLTDHADTAAAAMRLLEVKLYDITRVVPAPAVAELRKVPLWLGVKDRHGKHPCACYHPDVSWLQANGYNPDKAKAVDIANAATFLRWTHEQPWMVLHELAHAYHNRVLGFDNADVRSAYDKAVAGKKYESVMHWNGDMVRHYALNNDQEYFAETTEAYFGVNDFYPFNRPELKAVDPDGYALMQKAWGDNGQRPSGKP
jgi:hypothetical protein